MVGPLSQLTAGNQQVGAFFGPDQNNYLKVAADRNGSSTNITVTYREKGTASTVATVAVPALTTASTVDLMLIGNTSSPDPATGKLAGWPLDHIQAAYSINGGAPIAVGTFKVPADVISWFSRMSKAGILVANPGTTTPITATFSDFSIVNSTGLPTTTATSATPVGAVVAGVSSSLCLDVTGNTSANSTPVEIYTCNGGANQSWTVGGGTLQSLGKCLDVTSAGTTNGTAVDLYDCNNTAAQVWTPQTNGTLLNPNSGKCLDDPASSTKAGTALQIYTCSGAKNQVWNLPTS